MLLMFLAFLLSRCAACFIIQARQPSNRFGARPKSLSFFWIGWLLSWRVSLPPGSWRLSCKAEYRANSNLSHKYALHDPGLSIWLARQGSNL